MDWNKIFYHHEGDLPGNVAVCWEGDWYKTGNRYHEEVELYKDNKFVRVVDIKEVYSIGRK